MRHTRNRQMLKLTGHNHWKGTYNLPIEVTRKWAREVDPTFEWHREEMIFRGINFGSNWVSFEHKGYLRNIKIK